MPELIQEFTDCRDVALRVDRVSSVLRGVKLLGLASRNGRRYLESALSAAAPLYEHAKVNVNHGASGPHAPRSYHDRLGVIRNVRIRAGEGLFGDLHFNPKQGIAEQLLWDAEYAPENVGLSHNVVARTASRGDETVVEAITSVQSVDLVADPATTSGLFEAESQGVEETSREEGGDSAGGGAGGGELPAIDALPSAARRERIYELLAEHDLPLPFAKNADAMAITSDAFFESLQTASNDDDLRRMVEDRAELVRAAAAWRPAIGRGQPPKSRDQIDAIGRRGAAPPDAAGFVEAITAA